MKRTASRDVGAGMAAALILAASALAQSESRPKYEFRLTLGLSLPGSVSSSEYRDDWTQDLLSRVNEEGLITPTTSGTVSCEGFAARFFTDSLGLQLGLGLYSFSAPNTSAFNFSYTWTNGASGGKSQAWTTGTGRMKSVPLSVNLLYESRGETWSLYASAGPTLFFNSFEAASTSGFGVSDSAKVTVYIPPNWVTTFIQTVDALPVPLAVPAQSWVSAGLDVGAGVDFRIGPQWAVTADVRYFMCPSKDLGWTWTQGTYSGLLGNLIGWPFTAENAAYAAERTTPITISPSSLRIAVGAKLIL